MKSFCIMSRGHADLKTVLCVAAFLLVWQFTIQRTVTPAYILPLPSDIFARIIETFWLQVYHLSYTSLTTVIGLLLALVIGVLLALSVIYLPGLKGVVLPFLATFNGIPKIAIAPLFIIWFGLGIESKILLAFLLALFPVFVNSLTGLGEIEDRKSTRLNSSH